MEQSEVFIDKVSKLLTDGGVAVAKATGKVVGYSGRALRSVKDRTTGMSMPHISGGWAKGLFTGGALKGWGGEKAHIKVNIARAKQKIEKLYFEIGKRGARLSGVEDISEHESVKELINEVKSYENQIQRWETRLKELDKERAETRSRKAYNKAGVKKEETNAVIKVRIREIIDKSIKAAEFENGSQKAIFDKVAHDMLDDDIEIRILAAAELGKMANPSAIPILKEALEYKNVYLSSEVINGLININDPSCLSIFKDNVRNENYRIRLGSLRGVYKLAGTDSVTYLINALKDEHPEVRKSSATFIGWVGVKDAVPALIQTLKDSDREVKKAAAMSLSILRDPSSVMPLIRALGDSDIEVREKIVHAMERISGRAVEFKIDASGEELKENLEKLKDWWQKSKSSDVDEALGGVADAAVEDEVEEDEVEEPEIAEADTAEETEVEAKAETEADENVSEEDGEEALTEDKLRTMLKKDLIQKCGDLDVEYSPDDTKAVLVEKILEKCGN